MDKQQSDHIENRIRQAAEGINPPFKEEAWLKMEELLNNEVTKRRRKGFFWWWFLPLLLVGGIAVFYYQYKSVDANGKGKVLTANAPGSATGTTDEPAPHESQGLAKQAHDAVKNEMRKNEDPAPTVDGSIAGKAPLTIQKEQKIKGKGPITAQPDAGAKSAIPTVGSVNTRSENRFGKKIKRSAAPKQADNNTIGNLKVDEDSFEKDQSFSAADLTGRRRKQGSAIDPNTGASGNAPRDPDRVTIGLIDNTNAGLRKPISSTLR